MFDWRACSTGGSLTIIIYVCATSADAMSRPYFSLKKPLRRDIYANCEYNKYLSNTKSSQHQLFVKRGYPVFTKRKSFNGVPTLSRAKRFRLSGNEPKKTFDRVRDPAWDTLYALCSPQRIHVETLYCVQASLHHRINSDVVI